jgi:hypothetical protein
MIFALGGGMERGLLAPLSPNEELALRHVASGLAYPTSASKGDVERLKKLGLVVQVDGELRLTAIGRDRYVKLPSLLSSTDKADQALVIIFNNVRR